jgi:hypothetical protein
MPRLVRRARMASTVAADGIYAEEDIPLAGIGPDGMGTAGSRSLRTWSSAIPIGMVRPLCGGTSIGGETKIRCYAPGESCDEKAVGGSLRPRSVSRFGYAG